ncbi:MAG: exodeoxyribonuclease III [Alphaproteobacteria bacterium]|nr:exodeoxyribonuclease III [Alphaproteobacteria bacterium]
MRIATWNINSVRRREKLLREWLEQTTPDVLLLQEIKCEEGQFPAAIFLSLGYEALVVGEKAYNGVAVLSRHKMKERLRALPGEKSGAARYLEVEVGDVIVSSLYLPNGNPTENGAGEKFLYKLSWLESFAAHARDLLRLERPVVLGGDYNIIPSARDCLDAEAWSGDALFRPESRRAFRALLNSGWTDALDDETSPVRVDRDRAPWTYWSYRGGAFAADDGIRIDHFLLSPSAADRLKSGGVDRDARADKDASDHAPVWCELREGDAAADAPADPAAVSDAPA